MLLYVIIPSALVGTLSGLILGRKKADSVTSYAFAGALPWLVLLVTLIYENHTKAGELGGAAMLLLVQSTAGTLAAATGLVSCAFVNSVWKIIF